jgi:hypothetical protein
MTPKYAAKVDANQPEMVSAIRATGSANALHIHMVGGGAPDIVVGCKNGFTVVGPDAALLLNHLRDYVRLSLKLGILFTSEIYEGANLLVEKRRFRLPRNSLPTKKNSTHPGPVRSTYGTASTLLWKGWGICYIDY